MKAKKNTRERSEQMQQVSTGLRDVTSDDPMAKRASESDVGRD